MGYIQKKIGRYFAEAGKFRKYVRRLKLKDFVDKYIGAIKK